MLAPQPWIETHLKFYYQMQAAVGEQITRVLDALAASEAYENTIVVFSSDHGDMQGAHGGMHEKWHVAYDEALRVPFIVSSPLLPGGARELEIPTNHADLVPTLLGLAGIDRDQALAKLKVDHVDARPLVGRDLSDAIRAAVPAAPSEPVLFTTDDEISEGSMPPKSPVQRVARSAVCRWLGCVTVENTRARRTSGRTSRSSLPDVAGHLIEAVAVGLERVHGRRARVSVRLGVVCWEGALKDVHPVLRHRAPAPRPTGTGTRRPRRALRTPTRPRSADGRQPIRKTRARHSTRRAPRDVLRDRRQSSVGPPDAPSQRLPPAATTARRPPPRVGVKSSGRNGANTNDQPNLSASVR